MSEVRAEASVPNGSPLPTDPNNLSSIDIPAIQDTTTVIPANAGIQLDENAFCLNTLDSRLRGNDLAESSRSNSRIPAVVLESVSVACKVIQYDPLILARADATSYSTTRETVFEKARGDLTTISHKTTTRDFWTAAMQIGGISVISAIADKPADRYATNHGASGIMPAVRNIGNALPLAAIGYSSVNFLTSDQDSLSGRTSYDALAAGGLGFASALSLKYMIGRARPGAEKGSNSFTPMNAGNGDTSWPSIHTTVVWSVITPYAKAYDAPWLYGVAAATNIARVTGRNHWFSDTVAGALIGYAIGDFIWSSHQTHEHQTVWIVTPDKISIRWRI